MKKKVLGKQRVKLSCERIYIGRAKERKKEGREQRHKEEDYD